LVGAVDSDQFGYLLTVETSLLENGQRAMIRDSMDNARKMAAAIEAEYELGRPA
jgi:hypothetical protein